MTQNSSTLRLTTDDDGVVWFGDDRHLATCSGKTADEFILSPIFRESKLVRVIGFPFNCPLVEKLYKAHLVAGLPDTVAVQVGSPAMVSTQEPAALLSAMWRSSVDLTATNSYWATLNSADYVSFALMSAVYRSGRVSDEAMRIARYHPAWPALSFVWKFDPISAIKLLVSVGDPRWFSHPVKPGRISRLYAYLGLNLANVRMLCGYTKVPGNNIERADNVVRVWRSDDASYDDAKQPRAFLARIEVANKYLDKGVLTASRRMIRLMREVWLANRSDDPEVRFIPRQFFRRRDEADAYVRHIKSGPDNSIDRVTGA